MVADIEYALDRELQAVLNSAANRGRESVDAGRSSSAVYVSSARSRSQIAWRSIIALEPRDGLA
jgi:hypothetical protein